MSRVYLVVATLALGTLLGWKTCSWHYDSIQLTAQKAAAEAQSKAQGREADIAAMVEEKLNNRSVQERVIERGVIREVQKPVYRRVCLEPDAIRLLNSAASGSTPAGYSTGSASEVP